MDYYIMSRQEVLLNGTSGDMVLVLVHLFKRKSHVFGGYLALKYSRHSANLR
jgi:hypothetical protein